MAASPTELLSDGGQRDHECCELNQDETAPVEAVSQRHQQQQASGEAELGCRWHGPDDCRLAREVELTRFRGHPNVSHGGVRDGVQEYPVHTGV
jgi:hypothetical protein